MQPECNSADLDRDKRSEARQAIRPAKENEAIDRIEESGYSCYEEDFYDTKVEIARLLGEEAPKPPAPEKPPAEQEAKRQDVSKPGWMRGQGGRNKDDREER